MQPEASAPGVAPASLACARIGGHAGASGQTVGASGNIASVAPGATDDEDPGDDAPQPPSSKQISGTPTTPPSTRKTCLENMLARSRCLRILPDLLAVL